MVYTFILNVLILILVYKNIYYSSF